MIMYYFNYTNRVYHYYGITSSLSRYLVTQDYFDSLAALTQTAVIFKAIPDFTPRGHEQGIPDDMVYLNFDSIQSPTALMYLKRKGGCYFEGIKYAMRYRVDGIVTLSAIDTIPQAGDKNRNLLPRQMIIIFSMMTGQLTACIIAFDQFTIELLQVVRNRDTGPSCAELQSPELPTSSIVHSQSYMSFPTKGGLRIGGKSPY